MSVVNAITGFQTGQYGEAIPLTVVDINGNAIDISSYTTKQVILQSPDQLKLITYTATFATNGTDGKISFIPALGDVDRDGIWLGQLVLSKASVVSKTYEFTFTVGKSLS